MIVELLKVNKQKWNTALKEAGPQGTIFQSTYWADYLEKTFGDRPIYVASLDKKGNFQGLLLAIESCYAKHPALTMLDRRGLIFGKIYKNLVSPMFHQLFPFIFWENGPIILPQSFVEDQLQKELLYREFVKKIILIAQKKNCYEIKFARPPFFDDQSEIFSSLGFIEERMGTILVNIDESPEVILKSFDRHVRQNLRRGNVQFIEVSQMNKHEELNEFYDLHIQTAKRTDTKTYPISYFDSMWNHFSPIHKIVIFIARVKEKPIAATLCLSHNDVIHCFAIYQSYYARSNNIFSNEVLLWHAIKWGHDNGFKYFDLSGVELDKIARGSKKALGIYRFKSKFGGKLIEYHDYKKFLQKKLIIKFLDHYLTDSGIHN